MAKSKKVIVICGIGVNDEKNYTYDFCKVFKHEKDADEYYDKKYIELLKLYSNGAINYYNIDYETQKIK